MSEKPLTCRYDDELTIGFDAEFVIQGPYKSFVPAFEHIGGNYKQARVGLDGITDIGEIRGFYSVKVPEIIRFMHKALREDCPIGVKMHRIVAGAYPSGHPVGCHIHFGRCQGGNFRQAIMSTVGLLLMLIEPRPDGLQRCNSAPNHTQYGRLDSFEEKPYGGTEYKMPWSFITTPKLMFTILTFAKLIAKLAGNEEAGGLEAEINIEGNSGIKMNAMDIYNNRRYDKAKEWFLNILFPMIDELPALYKKHHEKEFALVPDEIEAIKIIEEWIENDWYLAEPDTDMRETWATPKEKVQFVYSPHFPEPLIQTKPSLKPIYVRMGESAKNHVLLSGFSLETAEKIAQELGKEGISCREINKLVSIRRACPTINLSQPITSNKIRTDILAVIQTILNGEH